jgi:hypothetical protein
LKMAALMRYTEFTSTFSLLLSYTTHSSASYLISMVNPKNSSSGNAMNLRSNLSTKFWRIHSLSRLMAIANHLCTLAVSSIATDKLCSQEDSALQRNRLREMQLSRVFNG